MKKYITILDFHMPDGRRFNVGEIVTFVNDSLQNYLLYEGYIKPHHENLSDISDKYSDWGIYGK